MTDDEWEAANAVKGRAPLRRGLSAGVSLKGMVRCGVCERPMSILSYGQQREKLTYACTRVGCGKVAMAVNKVEPVVLEMCQQAVVDDEPHVAATLADDSRYSDALDGVAQAQAALAEYRDSIELQQELGIRDFAAGLRVRREAVEVARQALRDTPRPEQRASITEEGDVWTWYTALVRRVVAEVLIYPKFAPERATLRWHGSEEPVAVGV